MGKTVDVGVGTMCTDSHVLGDSFVPQLATDVVSDLIQRHKTLHQCETRVQRVWVERVDRAG
jgi:hypothetical protein